MCLPAAAVGAITAATSAISSIAGYAQEQSNHRAQMQAYRESQRAYQEQINNNAKAANRAYESEQRKLQAAFAQSAMEAQSRQIESLQQQGTILASGRQGQSIGALVSDADRTYGRDLALLGMNLGYAQQDYALGTENIFLDATSANNMAASSRMARPTKPSAFGLVTGLAGAGLGGYQAYSSLKAPPATNPNPTPSP